MSSNIQDSYLSYPPPASNTVDMVYAEHKKSPMLSYTSPIVRGVMAVTLIAVVVGSFMYLSRRTSPWLDNGDNIYFTKGNVGIGTADPDSDMRLQINGSIASTLGNALPRFIFSSNDTGTTGSEFGGYIGRKYGNTGAITELYSFGNQTAGQAHAFRNIGGATLVTIGDTGRVGIGITDPAVPLHVGTFFATSHNLLAEYATTVNPGGTGNTTQDVSIYAVNRIRTDASFIVTSDARIKKDITEVDDGAALAKLRLIEPAEYSYVDSVQRGTKRVFGFIAQQVREHFPEATTIVKDFIPDVMSIQALNLVHQTIQVQGKAKTGRLRLMTKSRRVDIEVTYVDSNTVSFVEGEITEEDVDDGKVFVYGYEVEDFHTLNKDYLFTINFAATQELDRKVQSLETQNSALQLQLQALQNVLREKGLIE